MCGTTLQTALSKDRVDYLCPGNYQGPFALVTDVQVYGAGNGENPATNSILMMPDDTSDRLVTINSPTRVVFNTLRITGGEVQAQDVQDSSGGGMLVANDDAEVTLADCVVAGNLAQRYGGDVYLQSGKLTIDNCEVSGNDSQWEGAGVATFGHLAIRFSVISDNRVLLNATGGGIYTNDDTSGNDATTEIHDTFITGSLAA